MPYIAIELTNAALELLKHLIATPSFSREEAETASILQDFLHERGIPTERQGNNVWTCNRYYDTAKPTVLLNSHHDTVKPNQDWTLDPFVPLEQDGKLYGLGSNDAGGALVSLVATFVHLYEREDLPFNLVLAASAEEEIIGRGGLESILPKLGRLDVAIVGEPTGLEIAIAEKGLLVLDCTAHGKSGHAARKTGINAIAEAMKDIAWFHSFRFPNESALLGPINMTVTQIQAGSQHNVIPDKCTFVVDVRTTDAYTNEETLSIIRQHVACEVQPRSTRLRPSAIASDHPLVQAGVRLGLHTFASPTMSDQTVLTIPSIKLGPGISERSHTANEFLLLEELQQGITTYIALLEEFARGLNG